MVWLAEKNNNCSISWYQEMFFKVEYFLICLNASPLASSLKLVLPPFYIILYKLQFHLDYLLHTLSSSTFGESQISCNVAERYKVAVAGATEWISNFGHQIQRRFWIWPPKFEIHSAIPAIAILILQPHCGKCDPHQIGIIYISFSRPFSPIYQVYRE
jgi:hypothetical protein